MAALDLYRSQVHSGAGECGFHETLASDRNNLFLPVVETCPLCAAVAAQRRVQQAADAEKAKNIEDPAAPLPTDGRRMGLRMLGPIEAEMRRQELRRSATTATARVVNMPSGSTRSR